MIQFSATSSKLNLALRRQEERANLILPMFATEKLTGMCAIADEFLGGLISRRLEQEQFDPQIKHCLIIDSDLTIPGLDKIILVGLGPRAKLTLGGLRVTLAEAFGWSRDSARSERLVFPLNDVELRGLTVEQFAEVVAEYACLTDYEINHAKTRNGFYDDEEPQAHLKSVTVLCPEWALSSAKRGLKLGHVIGEATNKARNMVNEPSDTMTPQKLVDTARAIARESNGTITCRVLQKPQMEKLGMNGILAVNAGSIDAAQLIVLTYKGGGDDAIDLVGKGITFDTGGLGIKDAEGMADMHSDMGGAAAVLCTMSLLPVLKPKVTVRAYVAATDNLIGSKAMRPSNILKMMSGLTVEIRHPDAEGRLTLADVLHYAQAKRGARKIIDLATLTGAVQDALGDLVTGVFGNDPAFTRKFLQSAKRAGEDMHECPMPEEYRRENESKKADLSNDGTGPGHIAAAWFLREFIGEGVSWIHCDIAATSFRANGRGVDPDGASGVGVRTLARLLHEYVK
jgi:leucyl aminopeptidase